MPSVPFSLQSNCPERNSTRSSSRFHRDNPEPVDIIAKCGHTPTYLATFYGPAILPMSALCSPCCRGARATVPCTPSCGTQRNFTITPRPTLTPKGPRRPSHHRLPPPLPEQPPEPLEEARSRLAQGTHLLPIPTHPAPVDVQPPLKTPKPPSRPGQLPRLSLPVHEVKLAAERGGVPSSHQAYPLLCKCHAASVPQLPAHEVTPTQGGRQRGK